MWASDVTPKKVRNRMSAFAESASKKTQQNNNRRRHVAVGEHVSAGRNEA